MWDIIPKRDERKDIINKRIMKKKAIIPFLALLLSQLLFSQVQLTSSTNALRHGDFLCRVEVPYANEGQRGEGSVWMLPEIPDDSHDYFQSILSNGDTIVIYEKGNVLSDESIDFFSMEIDTLLIDLDKYGMTENDFFVRSASLWRNQYIINVDDGLLSVSYDLTDISSFPRPEYMKPYSEVFVRNDTLMVSSGDDFFEFTEYFDSQECIWKQKEKWLRDPAHRIELNCEDNDYRILYADWGDNNRPMLIFWDKRTNDKHYFNLKMEKLINFQNEYFVIGAKSIITIKEYSKSFPKLLIENLQIHENNLEIKNVSAFCKSGILYILRNDEKETFLAKLSGVQLEKVYSFPFRLNFNDKPKYNHVSNQYDDRVMLPFFVNDYHNSGFLEIVGNKIHLHFLRGISNSTRYKL